MCCRCMFGYMRESGTLKKLGRLSSGFNIFVPALRNAFKAQLAVVLAQNNLDNTNWNQLRRLVPLWAKRNVAWSVWAFPPSSKYVGLLMRKHGNLSRYCAAKDQGIFLVITCLVNIGRCILGSKKSKLTNCFLVPEHFYYQSFQFKICQRHFWISCCASHILIHFAYWYSGFLQSNFKAKAPETYVGSTSQNDEWTHGPAANSFLVHGKLHPMLSTKCGLKLAGMNKNQMCTIFPVIVLVVDRARLFVNAFSYLLNVL